MSEAEALIAERAMRTARGEDALEQGWLLRELVDRFGLGQEELGRRFDRSKSWVSRRLALVAAGGDPGDSPPRAPGSARVEKLLGKAAA